MVVKAGMNRKMTAGIKGHALVLRTLGSFPDAFITAIFAETRIYLQGSLKAPSDQYKVALHDLGSEEGGRIQKVELYVMQQAAAYRPSEGSAYLRLSGNFQVARGATEVRLGIQYQGDDRAACEPMCFGIPRYLQELPGLRV